VIASIFFPSPSPRCIGGRAHVHHLTPEDIDDLSASARVVASALTLMRAISRSTNSTSRKSITLMTFTSLRSC